jgi:hypothetical protein
MGAVMGSHDGGAPRHDLAVGLPCRERAGTVKAPGDGDMARGRSDFFAGLQGPGNGLAAGTQPVTAGGQAGAAGWPLVAAWSNPRLGLPRRPRASVQQHPALSRPHRRRH